MLHSLMLWLYYLQNTWAVTNWDVSPFRTSCFKIVPCSIWFEAEVREDFGCELSVLSLTEFVLEGISHSPELSHIDWIIVRYAAVKWKFKRFNIIILHFEVQDQLINSSHLSRSFRQQNPFQHFQDTPVSI